jgi:hypothetical protein
MLQAGGTWLLSFMGGSLARYGQIYAFAEAENTEAGGLTWNTWLQ